VSETRVLHPALSPRIGAGDRPGFQKNAEECGCGLDNKARSKEDAEKSNGLVKIPSAAKAAR
jgi:hypothetical protein